MKTMKHLRQLSNLFLIFLLLLVSAPVWAGTQWDIAVLFLGKNPATDVEFQKDIDRNVLELARVKETSSLNISLYREMPNGTYSYSTRGKQDLKLQSLLAATETGSVNIKGKFQKLDRNRLANFLQTSFSNKQSKKMLVVYGHGTGPEGLKEMPTIEMKKVLSDSGIHLDILWFDSCFMGNLEFLFEIHSFSDFAIASQEAEFTSGLPFETINSLASIESPATASLFLAKSYIESYSYHLNGSQRQNVSTSSATVAVLDNQKFEEQISGLQTAAHFFKSLSQADQKKLRERLKKNFKMENPSLIDLGHLLIELRSLNKDKTIDQTFTKLIRELNIDSVKKLKTNPRIKVTPPVTGATLVYGFNNWKNGFESEFINSIFEDLLPHEEFIAGPANKSWPSFKVEQENLLIVPFAPGVSSFNYYWINPISKKALSKEIQITRNSDIYETSSPNRFVTYSAYTQSMGNKAEKYTGLNVSLLGEAPSFDYFESEFNQAVQWLAL